MAVPEFQHLRCRVENDVLIAVLLPQRIQGDELAESLRDELHSAVDHYPVKNLILDFQQVHYLGSAGFRPLLSIHRKLQGFAGRMVLCHLSTEVAEVFLITRLVSTSRMTTAPFEHAKDVEEALAQLRSGSA